MLARIAPIALVAASFAACFIPSHAWGTARIAWTLEGRADPALCATHDAELTHVVIRADDDDVAAEDWWPCRHLVAGYVLRRGWYRATLTLADANRASVGRSRESSSFHVDDEGDVLVELDLTPATLITSGLDRD